VGVGFGGEMVDGDAVMGWAGHAAWYNMDGKAESQVSEVLDAPLSGVSCVVEEGVLMLRFTRPLDYGRVTLEPAKAAPLLWAVGPQPQKSNHGNGGRGSFRLSLGSGEAKVELTALAMGKVAHGVLMLLGWGVLLPQGILAARYLKWRGPLFYKLHLRLQISGMLLGVAGLVLALVQFAPFGGGVGGHSLLGLVVSALGLLQPLNGALRPKKGAPRRVLWEVLHKGSGYLAMLLAVPTIYLGILTLHEQEAIALPRTLAGFGGAYTAVLAATLLAAGVMQARGWATASTPPPLSKGDASKAEAPPPRKSEAYSSGVGVAARTGSPGQYTSAPLPSRTELKDNQA